MADLHGDTHHPLLVPVPRAEGVSAALLPGLWGGDILLIVPGK